MVYAELRSIAAQRRRRAQRPGHTLQPTALANEAYLRLQGLKNVPWHDRTHFFAMASRSSGGSWWTMRALDRRRSAERMRRASS